MNNISPAFRKTFLVSCLSMFIGITLNAATCTFTNGGGDNSWHNAANWDAGIIPDNDDDAVVNNIAVNITSAIDVNSLSINGSAVVTFSHNGWSSIGDLALSSGSMSSNKQIEILNSFNWTGTSTLTATTYIELASTCVSTISGSGNRNLIGNLINSGILTHSGGTLRLQSGAVFENGGTYTFDGASFIIGTSGEIFENRGTLNKNNANELSFFTYLEQSSSGILNVNAGTLNLLWGGDSFGSSSMTVASGATLEFSSGSYDFAAASNVSGLGIVEYSGGTITGSGAFNVSGETKISSGTVNFNQSLTTLGKLTISGGTLQGASQIVVTDQFSWSGTSSISTSSSLKIANTATALLFSTGSKKLYTTLTNEGAISHSAGDLNFYPRGNVLNNGTYSLSGLSNLTDSGGGAFENNGNFINNKLGSSSVGPDFNNNANGVIEGKGTFVFNNLTNNGTVATDAAFGTLFLTGTFANGSALDIGFDNASYGSLVVSSDIVLSGDLNVDVSGILPIGTYPILSSTTGSISGTFDAENIPSGFVLEYTSNTVSLMASALPVEFLSFEVLAQPRDVLLKWQTALEIKSDLFIIEHSRDGQNFIAIGEVQAAGNSSSIQDYQFTHDTPGSGVNYYRLRQLDLDGSFDYSDLRYVNFYNFNKDITVYPNPTLGNVIIKNQSDKELTITVRELSGKIVYVRKGVVSGAISMDLTHLPKAMYTLEFKDDTFFKQIEKIMILE